MIVVAAETVIVSEISQLRSHASVGPIYKQIPLSFARALSPLAMAMPETNRWHWEVMIDLSRRQRDRADLGVGDRSSSLAREASYDLTATIYDLPRNSSRNTSQDSARCCRATRQEEPHGSADHGALDCAYDAKSSRENIHLECTPPWAT